MYIKPPPGFLLHGLDLHTLKRISSTHKYRSKTRGPNGSAIITPAILKLSAHPPMKAHIYVSVDLKIQGSIRVSISYPIKTSSGTPGIRIKPINRQPLRSREVYIPSQGFESSHLVRPPLSSRLFLRQSVYTPLHDPVIF